MKDTEKVKSPVIKTVICLMAALMILPLVVACADNPTNGVDTTVPSDNASETTVASATTSNELTYEKDRLPDDLKFGGKDVTILMWSDHTMQEFYSEKQDGEAINDAIFKRNESVNERLGVTLKFVESPGNSDNKQEYISKVTANTEGEYQIYAAYSQIPATLAMDGRLADLKSTKYLDFEMPWWPSSLINEATINGKLYFCSGDISTNLLWMMIATFYNEELITSNNLENPYDLVKSNQWTIDKLIEMCTGVYSELDGVAGKTQGDMFGYIIANINMDAFATACDIVSIEKDSEDKMIISPSYGGEKIGNLITKLTTWFTAGTDTCNDSSVNIRQVFFAERSIFTTDRVFIVAGKDNASDTSKIEFKYGIVPNPKYDAEQENFYTNIGYPFTLYCIAETATDDDADMASAVLEALASLNYRSVTPAVFESAMKVKYASDDKASEMYDIIRGSVRFELGRIFTTTFSNYTSNQFRTAILNKTEWARTYTMISGPINKQIASIMEKLK